MSDESVEPNISDDAPDQMYYPAADEPQLTFRAVLVGCLVGSIVSCTNIYIGLKIGWSFGASIISAVLAFSFFTMFNKRLSVLETNIAQTAGSAAGSMASAAGLLAAIPAMMLLGYDFTWYGLMLWGVAVAFLGVFFAVPLRRQVIDVDRLRFPTGTATAETIMAMHGDASEAMAKAKVLLIAGLCAGAYTLAYHFFPQLESPPVHKWFPNAYLVLAASWTFTIYLGPSLFGAGFLIGPRVVLSLLAGAVIAWAITGPLVQQAGWAPGEVMSYKDGPRGWLLWPGVALMVCEALGALALSWRTFVNALKMPVHQKMEGASSTIPDESQIPNSWWIGGLITGSLLTVIITTTIFNIEWYLVLIAIALSAVLAIVAVRSTGETDINPVGGMGKVTQLVFGGIAPGSMSTNLMSAGITAAGASQAADMMQDLKTGSMLGAAPRKQLLAQLCGICFGIFFVIPVFFLFTKAYKIGGEQLPAPAAFAWKAMAELLNKGFDALPPFSVHAVIVAGVFGLLIAIFSQFPKMKPYLPSGLAMGIAFIIPAFYSLVMFYGLVAWLIWRAVAPSQTEKYTFALASGLIAGEGLMGIVNAGLTLLGIKSIT